MIACGKEFTLVIEPAVCAFNTCSTDDRVSSNGELVNDHGLAYAPEFCYAMVQTTNQPGFNTIFIYRFLPESNSLSLKSFMAFESDVSCSNWVYDALHKKFVAIAGVRVLVFDPQTETLDYFDTVPGGIRLVYVPQKGRIYGQMGVQDDMAVVGYIDMEARVIVQLGTIPLGFNGSHARPYNYVYCPLTNCLYGCWITGFGASMAKFDLNTNTGTASIIPAGIEGTEVAYDSDRNLIVVHFGTAKEVDPVSETIVRTNIIPDTTGNASWSPFYVPSMKKVFGFGYSAVNGEDEPVIISYSTEDYTTTVARNDNPTALGYWGGVRLNGAGSLLTNAFQDGIDDDGVRRVCVGGDNIPYEELPPLDPPAVTPTGDSLAYFAASVLALSLDATNNIALWNPLDSANRGSAVATGLGVFYGTGIDPTMGDWPKDTVLTWIARSSVSPGRRFMGLRYQDNALAWQWFVAVDLARIWETVTDFANVNPNPNVQFQPQTYENASNELRIEQLYDRRVLTAVASLGGTHTLYENISYAPGANTYYNLSATTNALFSPTGQIELSPIVALAINQYGSGQYEIVSGGWVYSSPTLLGVYTWFDYVAHPHPAAPDPLPTFTVSKGGVDGWEMGGWTP